ncbi:MAG: peptide chain release factor-like protein [Planctomycetota bacterium]|nr:peptide chain release factor-like protein [Planctomycetaceae bacterium]MDQ3332811.1 peptide chain release factor-like protein [Planctomycetota bacterium]
MPRHPATRSVEELLRECSERHVRRSGPGGQNRNKVETGIVLTHDPTGVSVEASERRTQRENKAVAIQRLRRALAVEVREHIDEAGPSELWRSRVRNRRIALNESHEDHPAMLAEALDVLAAHQWDLASAAERLQVSASQLAKLLKTEPKAFKRLNDERMARGAAPLK